MMKIAITLITAAVLLSSCNNSENSNNVKLSDITKLESELFSSRLEAPDMIKLNQLADMYIVYANQHPDDSTAPEFLFKAADINMNMSNPQVTIGLFTDIISKYPNFENISTIMFLKGFVYEDQLNDFVNAKKCYLEFLELYPESDFADDAAVSLKNLGKSPEELIKEFEQNNKNQ
jgi:outer membrane protein assembly factor BamD (BamD/ComL family)